MPGASVFSLTVTQGEVGGRSQPSSPKAGLWLYQLPAGCWEGLAQPCDSGDQAQPPLELAHPPGPGQLGSYPRDTNNFLTYYCWAFRE